MRTHLIVVAMFALTGCGASVQPTPTAPPQVPAAPLVPPAAVDACLALLFRGADVTPPDVARWFAQGIVPTAVVSGQ